MRSDCYYVAHVVGQNSRNRVTQGSTPIPTGDFPPAQGLIVRIKTAGQPRLEFRAFCRQYV